MKNGVRTERARNNMYVMWCHTLVVIVLMIAYFMEYRLGARTLEYFLIMSVLGIAPVLAEHYFFRKNEESGAIKHLVGYGFAFFYGYLLFTANSPLTFTYVLLMILATSVFNDIKFALKVNGGVIVLNIIQIIIGSKNNSMGYIGRSTSMIQIILIVFCAGFSIVLTKVLEANSRQKLEAIKRQQQKAEELYESTITTAKKMTEDIESIYVKLRELYETAGHTKDAMEQVNQGAADTAQAVQSQLLQTTQIQQLLDEVDAATNQISSEMITTKEEIAAGRTNMGQMVGQVNASVDTGSSVAVQLEALDSKMKEMNSIISIIDEITSNTELLALNASIEAARAGEYGKGFGVVAAQITSMASQTKNATISISELIGNVSGAISSVVTAIKDMIEGINESKKITVSTETSFNEIAGSAGVMSDNIESLTGILSRLIKANVEIVDSIQTVSSVTEEVSAHADETYNAELNNGEIISEITELMGDLKKLTEQLGIEN